MTLSCLWLTASNLKWTIDNYVDFFADRGNEQYAWIRDLHQKHGISNSSVISLFKGTFKVKNLRGGTLQFFTTADEEQYLLALLEGYLDLKTHLDRRVWIDQDFIRALRKMFQQVDSEQLVVAIEKWGKIIAAQDHDRDYLRLFEEIINKGKFENPYLPTA